MPTAHARNAARAVAATYQALTRAHCRMGAMLLLERMLRGTRVVRAIAAGIEIHLGLGGADGAEDQRDGQQESFHDGPVEVVGKRIKPVEPAGSRLDRFCNAR